MHVTLDHLAIDRLREERLDWRYKALPAAAHGRTVDEYLATEPGLAELGTPLLTLDAAALAHNAAVLAAWTAARGLLLAPHGKTTMAPELWRSQLDAGAWAITVATLPQLRVARAFGVSRVLLAGSLLDPAGLAWLSAELDAHPGFDFLCWVDSRRAVRLMDAALRACGARRPVEVCVELGAHGGRTGVREEDEALLIAEDVRRSPVLRLAGLGGYEGALAHDTSPAGLAAVDAYLHRMTALHHRLRYETDDPVVSAGGSAYPDRVAAVLDGLDARVVLRCGAYLVHDDGFYRAISPFGQEPGGSPLRSAMHGWARVVSRPESRLALLDAGKRDLPFDEGLPQPQLVRGKGPLPGAEITALDDQHAFLRGPLDGVEVGDVLRLGLSHPCTALDKWTLLPVLDDAAAAEPRVVDLIRTWF